MVLRKLRSGEDPAVRWQSGKYIEAPVRTDEWRDQKLLGEYLFNCIEHIEAAGMYATVDEETESLTCMDYILQRAARKKRTKRRASYKTKEKIKTSLKSMDIIVFPDSYHGSNTEMRSIIAQGHYHYPEGVGSAHDKKETYRNGKKLTVADQIHEDLALHGGGGEDLQSFMYRYYGMRYNLLTAIAEFYFKNPNAHPELSHCSSVTEDPDLGWVNTPVNCLTQFIEADKLATDRGNKTSRYANYITTDSFVNIVNGGARCGVYSHTTYNNVDIYTRSSCLDAVLNRELSEVFERGTVTPFSNKMYRFEMGNDCIFEGTTVPCIQKLIDDPDASRFFYKLNEGTREGTRIDDSGFMDILSQPYKFRVSKGSGIEETTTIDHMMDTGINLDAILTYPNIGHLLTEETYCKSTDAIEIGQDPNIACIEKLLTNLRNHKYTDQNEQMIYPRFDKIDKSVSDYIAFGNCWDGITSTGCTSYLIDIILDSGDERMRKMLSDIISKHPLSNLKCTDLTLDEPRTTNCLDKIIGSSTTNLMLLLEESGTLIDTMDCKGWDNFPINCIDRLFQRHEMWVYTENRIKELKREKETNDVDEEAINLEFEAHIHRVAEDPGFSRVAPQCDLGTQKVHSPSKTFSGFADSVARQIEYYKTVSDGSIRDKINYSRELMASITSETPSREIAIVPRIYKIVDAYFPHLRGMNIKDFENAGFWELIMTRDSPISFNMFECKDDKNRTISCIQKHINEVGKYCEVGSRDVSCDSALVSVMKMKDLFKEGMCTDYTTTESGEKIPCLVYAFSELSDKIDTDLYTVMLSRGDFGKTRDFKVRDEFGVMKSLSELICSHVSIEGISSLLDKQHIFTSDEKQAIQNQSPSHDGAAFKLYSNCLCGGIKDPMEKRICLDTQCFREYVHGSATNRNWAVSFLSSDNTPEAYRRKGSRIVFDLPPTRTRDAYYPYVYNGSEDYFGLGGVYNLEFNPSDYHITNIDRTDASGKSTSVFNLETALNALYPSVLRTKGMTITMPIPEIDNEGTYISDGKGKIKEFRGKATMEAIYLNKPPDPSGEYEFVIKFSHQDDRFKSGTYSWTVNYPAIEAFGAKGIFGRSDLKNIVVKYAKEQELIKQLSTRQKAAEGKTNLKLVISNRPADFMRASTCQAWRSCLHSNLNGSGFNSNALPQYIGTGGYVAYIANDEFSPTWFARAFMLPLMARKAGDPLRTGEWVTENSDANNNFRIPKVYGATSHKILLEDALMQILRGKGYNTTDLRSGGTDWYITNQSIMRQKKNMWETALHEAFINCIEKEPEMPELVTLPSGKTMSLPECKLFRITNSTLANDDTIDIAHNMGLLSDRTYNRTLAIPLWYKYNEQYNAIYGKVSDVDLEISKRGGNTNVIYLKPLTVPA